MMPKDDPAFLLIVTILYCIYSQSPALIHEPETSSETCVLTNQRNLNFAKHIDPVEILKCILALEL